VRAWWSNIRAVSVIIWQQSCKCDDLTAELCDDVSRGVTRNKIACCGPGLYEATLDMASFCTWKQCPVSGSEWTNFKCIDIEANIFPLHCWVIYLLQGGKECPGRDAENLTLSSAKVINEWNYISTPCATSCRARDSNTSRIHMLLIDNVSGSEFPVSTIQLNQPSRNVPVDAGFHASKLSCLGKNKEKFRRTIIKKWILKSVEGSANVLIRGRVNIWRWRNNC
jgi:hypothetical protein